MCARCGAKNATLFLNMMLFAMLSFMYTDFLCLFLNMFMFNCVKQCMLFTRRFVHVKFRV